MTLSTGRALALSAIVACIGPSFALLEGGDTHPELAGHHIKSQFFEVPPCALEAPTDTREYEAWRQNCSVRSVYQSAERQRKNALYSLLFRYRSEQFGEGSWKCDQHDPQRFTEHHGVICYSNSPTPAPNVEARMRRGPAQDSTSTISTTTSSSVEVNCTQAGWWACFISPSCCATGSPNGGGSTTPEPSTTSFTPATTSSVSPTASTTTASPTSVPTTSPTTATPTSLAPTPAPTAPTTQSPTPVPCSGTTAGSGAFMYACNEGETFWTGASCQLELIQPCNVESSLQFYDELIMQRDLGSNDAQQAAVYQHANIAKMSTWLAISSAYYHGTGCGGLPQSMDANAIRLLFAYFVSAIAPNATITYSSDNSTFDFTNVSVYINLAEASFNHPSRGYPDYTGTYNWHDVWDVRMAELPAYDLSALLLVKVAAHVCVDKGQWIDSMLGMFGFNDEKQAIYSTFNVTDALGANGQDLNNNDGLCTELSTILTDFYYALTEQEEFFPLEGSETYQANPNHPHDQSLGAEDCHKFPHYHWHRRAATVIANINRLLTKVKLDNYHVYPTNAPTATPTRSPTAYPTKAPTTTPPTNWFSCMSGETEVVTATSPARVVDLKPGDIVRGVGEDRQPRDCRVLNVGSWGYGTVFGNYTSHHLLVDTRGNVGFAGTKQPASVVEKYMVMTDCPAALDNSGNLFTPMDGDFCGSRSLSWSDYLHLYRAYVDLVSSTGTFWTDQSAFPNTTAIGEMTPSLCQEFFTCAVDGGNCTAFEAIASEIVSTQLTSEHRNTTQFAYPGLGDPTSPHSPSYKAKAVVQFGRTSSSSSSTKRGWVDIPISILVLLLLIAAIGMLATCTLWRRLQRGQQKEQPVGMNQIALGVAAHEPPSQYPPRMYEDGDYAASSV
eukprot:m.184422 g.184422  ORF g.184422 m.184422 type:complete len:896 (-) comp16140_c0_seq1:105-2792(-)